MLILTPEPVTVAPHVVRGCGKCDGAGVEDSVVVLGDAGTQCTRGSCQDGGQEGLIEVADWRAGTDLGGCQLRAAGSWMWESRLGASRGASPAYPWALAQGSP